MTAPVVIDVKILGMRPSDRYALRRLVVAAQVGFESRHPEVQVRISEDDEPSHINALVPYLVHPSLVINGKVVCTRTIPTQAQVSAWLQEAMPK